MSIEDYIPTTFPNQDHRNVKQALVQPRFADHECSDAIRSTMVDARVPVPGRTNRRRRYHSCMRLTKIAGQECQMNF